MFPVIWAGGIEYADLPAFYSEADVFVMASIRESLGLSYLEAQACGCPVIGLKGVAEEAIIDGETGLLAEVGNRDDLSCKIFNIFKDESFKNFLVANARERVDECFNWNDIVKQTTDIFVKLLACDMGS